MHTRNEQNLANGADDTLLNIIGIYKRPSKRSHERTSYSQSLCHAGLINVIGPAAAKH